MLPKVIIVDDDHSVRLSLRALFESHDICVQDFGSGQPFLDQFEDDNTTVLILDMHLPDLDGSQILHELRLNRSKGLPIVMITGRSEPGMDEDLLAKGANRFLKKPFDGDQLVEITKQLHLTR